jgi:MFS family permease
MVKKNSYLLSVLNHRYSWFVVFLLWVSHAIYFFIFNGLGVLGPLLKQELSLNNAQFGLLFSFMFMGSMMSQIPAGIWCDRTGVKKVMGLGFLIIGISTLFFSFSQSSLSIYILFFFLGIGIGFSQVSAAKSIIDWFPFKGRATAMGIKQTGVNLGGILSSLLLPVFIGIYPWRFLIGSISLIALAFAFLFFFSYRDLLDGSHPSNKVEHFRLKDSFASFKSKDFMMVTLAGILLLVVQFSYSTYIVLYLNQTLSYSIKMSGFILALSYGVGAIGRVGWSFWSDYFFKNRESVLIFIGGLGALAVALLSFTLPSTPRWIIYFISILFGLTGMGWNAVWLTLIGEISSKRGTGIGIGFSFFVANLGMVFGPTLFGWFVDLFNSFKIPWLFLTLCMAMVSVFILSIIHKIPSHGRG